MRRHATLLIVIFFIFSSTLLLIASIPNVPTGTWKTWTDMSSVRSGAAAVALSDGRALIAGGSDANGALASVDLFNTDGHFSAGHAMNSQRSNFAATLLQDGRVLVTGGITGGGGITNSAEIYDPSADTWTLVSAAMVDARSGHTASLLQDGRVLLAGGQNSGGAVSSLEIFDPASGKFSRAGVMSSPRMNHAAAVLPDGRVLIVAGSDGTNPLNSSDIYDPNPGSVTAGPNLSSPRTLASATTTLDGKVVVIGGNNGSTDLASAEIYDPSTGQFSLSASSLATARSGHQAFLLPNNNSISVIGGSSSGTDLNSAELYYAWADAFQSTGAMSVARAGFAGSALSLDGYFLAAGGTGLASSELYRFSTVKTDAADYPPGTTVNISGSGWQPGETVTLTLVEVPYYDSHGPFNTVADANGNISDSSFVTDQHDQNIRFYLTAVGSQSGLQAQNTFTDAGTANVNFATSGLPSGAAITATIVSYTNNGGQVKSNVAVPFTTPGPSGNTGTQPGSTLTYSFPASITIGGSTYNFLSGSPASGFTTGSNQTTKTVTGTYVLACTPPSITAQPSDATATVGNPVTFSVTATGTSPSFQWYFNNNLIPGATSSTYTISSVASTDAGSYYVNVVNGCGNVNSSAATLSVNKKSQTITFGALSNKTYGDGDFTVSATASSGLTVTFVAAGQCTVSGTTVHITGAGNCTITAQQPGDNTTWAAAADVPQSFTINQAHLTVKADDQAKTYDGVLFSAFTATLSGFVNGETDSNLRGSGSLSGNAGFTGAAATSKNAGSYTITPTAGTLTATNYDFTIFQNGTLTINKVHLTVKADDQAKTYDGAVFSPFTATLSGFVNSETEAVLRGSGALSGDASFTGAATTAKDAGSYTITPTAGTLTATNYDFTTFQNGTLTINKVHLTVKADDKSKTYDGAAFTAFTATITGFVNGESNSVVSGGASFSGTAVSAVNAGIYTITPGVGTLTANNYDFTTFQNGTLTIQQADATINVTGFTGIYDGNAHGATGTATGVKSEDLSSLLHLGATFTNVPGGTANWTFDGNTNYKAANGSATITITQADATIKVNGYSGVYDGNAHGAIGTATGVKSEDLSSLLQLGATFTNVPGGTANWTFAGNTNYKAANGSVAITITQADATIKVNGYSGVYDGNAHGATGTATGVKSEDLSSLLQLGATFTNVPGGTANWTFPGNTNYKAANGSVAITITQADATIKVNGYSGVYDGNPHGATGTATGVKSEDLSSLLNLGASFTDVPGGTANWSFAGNTNYKAASGSATITITQADAIIKVNGYSGVYDGNAHGATGTATGVKSEDLSSLLNLGASFTDAPGGTANWSFAGNTNYKAANGSITITITQADATIKVNGYSGVYDGNAHGATGTASGVKSEDLSSLLNLGASFTDAPGGTANWSFAGNTNYKAASGSATITITQADAIIKVNGYSGVYDGNAHGATGTATGVKSEDLSSLLNLGASFTDVPGGTANWSFAGNTNYKAASGSATITITQADATIKVNGYSGVYDGNAHGATGTATGVKSEDLSSLLNLGASFTDVPGGTASWSFAGNTNYKPAGASVAITISKANAAIKVTPYNVTYDGAAHTAMGTATGVKGETLSGLNLSGTTHTGAGDYPSDSWTFTDSTGDYNNDAGTLHDSISKADQTITFGALTNKTFGDPDFSVAATASSGLVVGFGASGNCTVSGSMVQITGAGSCTITASQPGDSNHNAAANVSQTFSIAPAPSVTAVTCPPNVTYNGSAQTPCSATVTGAGELKQPLTVSYSSNINAGTATASASYAGDVNHIGSYGSTTFTIDKASSTTSVNCPATAIYSGSPLTPCTANVTGIGGLSQSLTVSYSNNINVGTATATASYAGDTNHNSSSGSKTFAITYNDNPNTSCLGDLNHSILQPINVDGSSVFKQGSTVPAKFRVCDANGNSVGNAGVVSNFILAAINGGTVSGVDEEVYSTAADTAFRWDPTSSQWIFNISTKNLKAGNTYYYQIMLNDGSSITFRYGLK